MSERDNSGPAFPFEYHNKTATPQPAFFEDGFINPGGAQQFAGMTLRDWFAGQALIAMGTWCPNPAAGSIPVDWGDGASVCQARAKYAFTQADAMLEARK